MLPNYLTTPIRIGALAGNALWSSTWSGWSGSAIYFFHHWRGGTKTWGWSGRMKIGFSTRPQERIEELVSQFWTSDWIALRALRPTTRIAEEKALHRMLAPFRLTGEWYRAEKPVHALAEWQGPLPTELDAVYRVLEAAA